MLQDIKNLDDIYELLKGNICDDPENYPGYILVKNDYDVCFRIFIYRELLQSTLTFYIDNSENPDNLIIYLRGLDVALNNHYENNSKEFVLAYNSNNNTYYDENNVYNIYDSTKNILDEIIRHYKIIKKDVLVESTRIEIGVSNVSYLIEHTLSQDYSEYGDNKYTDDGIQASNKYKDENLNLSTYSSISDFQNYINSKNNTANQRFVNDLENTTIDEEFKQIIDEIFDNYNIDKELYIRFSPHDEIEGVRETQVKLAIEKDGKILQYEDDPEYYDSIVAKEKTPLFNRNLIYQNNKIDYIENKLFNYFAFNITTGGTINFTGTGSNVLYYSKNNGITWIEASGNISVSAGDKILWKGITTPVEDDDEEIYGIGTFGGDTSARYTVGGNIMSLLFGDEYNKYTSLKGKDYALYELFYNNKNITSAENILLPATTLADWCYSYMFQSCTSLTTAPELPATTLASYCYNSMFQGCKSLTSAPELPATILTDYCYGGMFYGCKSLTTAPELPAITLANGCYRSMFQDCTSLTTTPELPATILAQGCYYYMFYNCKSLTTVPSVLPATTLTQGCYSNMFRSCANLTTAPELPATTLVDNCYISMFQDCTSLNYIKAMFKTEPSSTYTSNWVKGVAPSGTFVKNDMTTWDVSGVNGVPSGWTVELICDYALHPLTFIARESGTFTLNIGSTVPTSLLSSVSYSIDNGETWVTTENVDSQSIVITTPEINTGNKVLWKGSGISMSIATGSTSAADRPASSSIFSSTGTFDVEGNIMSLLYEDNFENIITFAENSSSNFALLFYSSTNVISTQNLVLPATTLTNCCYLRMLQDCTSLITVPDLSATILGEACYHSMFRGCASLTTAPELPVTTLANSCYYAMFYNCSSLATAPELPATTLADSCYCAMFYGCTSLTTTSELPATTLAEACYQYMFRVCTSLTTAPELPATTLANNCYYGTFMGCTNLTTAPELQVTTLANGCYYQMFQGCTSLTTAPELPATTLTDKCYYGMFYGCTSLTSAPELPATTLTDSCYTWMFRECANITITPELPATTLADSCYHGMFQGCTSLTTAPELPATTLAEHCYQYLFRNCTNLTTVPELPATTLANNCYYCMFDSCTKLTVVPELPATTLADSCYYGMFYGCTSLTSAPELPATTLVQSCYGGMFYGCTSLTIAPELPTTTLVDSCYKQMFQGCTNLNSITCLATNISASQCTYDWVSGVAANGTFVKDKSMEDWSVGNSGIPTGWNVETA